MSKCVIASVAMENLDRMVAICAEQKAYLCAPLNYFKDRLIEDPEKPVINTVSDLEKVLEGYGYLKFEDYAQHKERFNDSLKEKKHDCSLTTLYESVNVQTFVYYQLEAYFEKIFNKLLNESRAFDPYLVYPSEFFKEEIKERFIENGDKMENVEDLIIILNKLNVWRFEEFDKQRRLQSSVDRIADGIKRVHFNKEK